MSSLARGAMAGLVHTTTSLNRWSCLDKQLPGVEKIRALHIYDFDNTLFNSPLPNPKLWNGPTIGFLQTQDSFNSGGWWHDSRILAATGDGLEKEAAKGWEGWWNEQIIELIMLSMKQKDALTVLLTGRSESGFADLIQKMVASRGMEFDMCVLKPKAGPNGQRFTSTIVFKQIFLESLMETYKQADELRIYEDRIKHVKGFRDFFSDYNRRQQSTGKYKATRGPITAEVIQVADGATLLDPVVEAAEVQKLINDHNQAVAGSGYGRRLMIKKTLFYTGYLINNTDTQKLLSLAKLPTGVPDSEIKYLANNILITPRPCPNSILEKVGGMGNKLLWEVVGSAVFENKIWAVNVRPVPSSAKYYTENPVPIVVLALRKGAKPIDATKIQNWQPIPPEKALIFETTVGEKVLLRVEDEDLRENEYESLFPTKTFKRKHMAEDESPRQSNGPNSHGPNGHGRSGRHRGGRGNFRGDDYGGRGNRNGANRGGNTNNNNHNNGGRSRHRGKQTANGGNPHYRSLDDVSASEPNSQSQQGFNAMAYEDFPSLRDAHNTQLQNSNQSAPRMYSQNRQASAPQRLPQQQQQPHPPQQQQYPPSHQSYPTHPPQPQHQSYPQYQQQAPTQGGPNGGLQYY